MTSDALGWWSDTWAFLTVFLTIIAAIAGVIAWKFATWTAQTKDAELKKYKSDAAVAIAQANDRAAQANREAQELKSKFAWRNLSVDQINTLIDLLSTKSGSVHIVFIGQDPESTTYATQLKICFTEAKWGVTFSGEAYLGNLVFGVQIPDDPDHPEQVDFIRKALTKIGIEYGKRPPPPPSAAAGDAATPADTEIVIGSKFPAQFSN